MDKLYALPISKPAQRAIEDTLRTASNPDHGKVDVIVKSLPEDRQKLIGKTARAMKSIGDDALARGKAKLLDMSQDEWDAIVNESIN
jgi:hypothetical protein